MLFKSFYFDSFILLFYTNLLSELQEPLVSPLPSVEHISPPGPKGEPNDRNDQPTTKAKENTETSLEPLDLIGKEKHELDLPLKMKEKEKFNLLDNLIMTKDEDYIQSAQQSDSSGSQPLLKVKEPESPYLDDNDFIDISSSSAVPSVNRNTKPATPAVHFAPSPPSFPPTIDRSKKPHAP